MFYVQTEFKQDLAAPGLVERLPEECIREILLRLNDPSDILRASQSCVTMDRIACEKRVWRELVQTHFTKAQIEFILSERPELKDNKDWQALHTALRRRYGIRQVYFHFEGSKRPMYVNYNLICFVGSNFYYFINFRILPKC